MLPGNASSHSLVRASFPDISMYTYTHKTSSQELGVLRNMIHVFCKTFPGKLVRDHYSADS